MSSDIERKIATSPIPVVEESERPSTSDVLQGTIALLAIGGLTLLLLPWVMGGAVMAAGYVLTQNLRNR